jgi:2-amino-4-hydroxy-6-hydroxymethyldihydropteridine diphosphokinase
MASPVRNNIANQENQILNGNLESPIISNRARVFLSLGSNLAGRAKNINRAIHFLNHNEIKVTRISPFYETKLVGDSSIFGLGIIRIVKLDFLNCVVETFTDYSPEKLLLTILKIEKVLGRRRIRGLRNFPRTIDIDILFYDDKIINQSVLKIPHPRISERAFVLVPLADLEPNLIHPVLNKTIQELQANVDKKGVRLWQKTESKVLV